MSGVAPADAGTGPGASSGPSGWRKEGGRGNGEMTPEEKKKHLTSRQKLDLICFLGPYTPSSVSNFFDWEMSFGLWPGQPGVYTWVSDVCST